MTTSTINEILQRAQIEETDAALRKDDQARRARRAQEEEQHQAPQAFGKKFSVPQLLRFIGASVLIGAAITFMVEHWHNSNDISRYFQFLGFTAVLTLSGFLCGTRLSDDRGARTFLALAAAIVPAHFTVLGALLYSSNPLALKHHYDGYAHFVAPFQVAVLTAAGATLVLIPIVWTAMLALARPRAALLTGAYLATNSLLLIPTRDGNWMGLLVLVMTVATAAFDLYLLQPTTALHTREGTFARTMMAVPAAIMAGRIFNLYDVTDLFVSGLFASTA